MKSNVRKPWSERIRYYAILMIATIGVLAVVIPSILLIEQFRTEKFLQTASGFHLTGALEAASSEKEIAIIIKNLESFERERRGADASFSVGKDAVLNASSSLFLLGGHISALLDIHSDYFDSRFENLIDRLKLQASDIENVTIALELDAEELSNVNGKLLTLQKSVDQIGRMHLIVHDELNERYLYQNRRNLLMLIVGVLASIVLTIFLIRYWLSAISEITREQELTESSLKKGEHDLRNSEERLRTAIESSAVGVAIVDRSGDIVTTNKALCDFLRRTQQEILGTNAIKIMDSGYWAPVFESLKLLFSGAENDFRVESRFNLRDGSVVWGIVVVAAIRGQRGKIGNFVIQVLDISDQKKIEEIQSEFVSTVSHELRTPLSSIHGALRILQGTMSNDLPDKAIDLVNISLRNSHRLIDLVNDILDIDQITSVAGLRFNVVRSNSGWMIRQAVKAVQPIINEKSTTIDLDIPREEVQIIVDPDRFEQALVNLISNAIKFSPEGGLVKISMEIKSARLRVSVSDQGPGIPLAFSETVFRRFGQVDSSDNRKSEGAGLGLYIAREIVRMMGGQIGFHSEPNVVTTFWIEFPIESYNKSAEAFGDRRSVSDQRDETMGWRG